MIFVGWGRAQRGPTTHSRDRHTLARRDNQGREFPAQMVNNKPNSILQFSGTPATGFLGRLGGQVSSPISCCCNDMLSLDCRLEGAPSIPKSCRKWRFSSKIRAFVHSSDLAVFGLAWCSRATLCCEPSAFPSSFSLPPSSFIRRWSPRCVGWSRIVAHPGWRGGPVASSPQPCAIWTALERTTWPAVEGCLSKRPTYGLFSFFPAQSFVRWRRSSLKK